MRGGSGMGGPGGGPGGRPGRPMGGMGGNWGGPPPRHTQPPMRRGWLPWSRHFWRRGYGYRGCGCFTLVLIAALPALTWAIFLA